MESGPEHAHHPHATGHRWLDILLAASAMLVSIVSLVVAVNHGRTMEKMAEANARLVAANSWPFLQYSTGNVGPNGQRMIELRVANDGVGPARVETFEVWWHDKPVATPQALLDACCSDGTAAVSTHGVQEDLVAPTIMRAGAMAAFLSLEQNADNAATWNRLNAARLHLRLRACFCSVFDECWTGDLTSTHANRVDKCPTPAVPYGLSTRWGTP